MQTHILVQKLYILHNALEITLFPPPMGRKSSTPPEVILTRVAAEHTEVEVRQCILFDKVLFVNKINRLQRAGKTLAGQPQPPPPTPTSQQ